MRWRGLAGGTAVLVGLGFGAGDGLAETAGRAVLPEIDLSGPGTEAPWIEGEFLGQGVSCMQLRMTSGEQVSLRGQDFSGFAIGAPLRLTGSFVMNSPCMQGRTFQATGVESLGRP